jgi:hypothetical protein
MRRSTPEPAPQDPGSSAEATLAGDDQHDAGASAVRLAQEVLERAMCAVLAHAVQVEAGVDLGLAAR